MQTRYPRPSRSWLAGVSTTALAAVLVALPAVAQAGVVQPQVVKPQPVTPHVTEPSQSASAPAPGPAPAPVPSPSSSSGSASAPRDAISGVPTPSPSSQLGGGSSGTPSAGSSQGSNGAGSGGSDSGGSDSNGKTPPPEGIPGPSSYDCQVDCQQEWLDWEKTRFFEIYDESLKRPQPSDAKFLESLRTDIRVVELDIKLMGGTVGKLSFDQNNPLSGTLWGSAASNGSSSGPIADTSSGTDPFAGTIFDTSGSSSGALAGTGLQPLEPLLEGAVGAVRSWLDGWAPQQQN